MNMTQRTESTFDATLKPASRGLLGEFDAPPGLPPAWAATKEAQYRALQLQKRVMVWCPAMLCLALGVIIGTSSVLPPIAKYVLVGVAGFVFSWVLSASRIQDRRTDALYKRVQPDKIKITKEQE